MISVNIPTFNGVEVLSDCIQSVLNQTYKDIEVIVVNDGSTDSTQDIIDYYVGLDKRVKGITIEHSGISVARQTALDNSEGEYIALLDTDCQMEPTRLKTQLKSIKDVSYSDYYMSMPNGIGYFPSGSMKGKTVKDILDRRYPNSNQTVPNFTIMARKECFKNVYRPEYKVNDDLILIIEWIKRGYDFKYIHKPLVMHKQTGYNVSNTKYAEVLEITNKIRSEEGV